MKTDYDNPGSSRSYSVSIPGPHSIVLSIHLPLTYPSLDAPIAVVSESFGLTESQCDAIIDDLVRAMRSHNPGIHAYANVCELVCCQASIFKRANGQVCLYEWIENVREKYTDSDYDPAAAICQLSVADDAPTVEDISAPQPIVDAETFKSDPQTLRPRVRTALFVRDPEREARLMPLIYHGTTLTDRKSTFQGHACPVTSVEDVRSFLAILMDDRKIERALHNMLAYRIVGDFIVKDNDEDGEDAAGSKMSHLLELMKVENVAVVVTRWYGGVLLGPDRFKHINTCARQAIEDGGFLVSSMLTKKKSKR